MIVFQICSGPNICQLSVHHQPYHRQEWRRLHGNNPRSLKIDIDSGHYRSSAFTRWAVMDVTACGGWWASITGSTIPRLRRIITGSVISSPVSAPVSTGHRAAAPGSPLTPAPVTIKNKSIWRNVWLLKEGLFRKHTIPIYFNIIISILCATVSYATKWTFWKGKSPFQALRNAPITAKKEALIF